MANNVHVLEARRNAMIDNFCANLNNGFIDIYDGSQPTNCDTALGAQVKLAHLGFGATAFAGAASGSASANAISADTAADATGTAAWATFTTSGGVRQLDCSVGAAACDINLNTTSIVQNANVSISALTISMAA